MTFTVGIVNADNLPGDAVVQNVAPTITDQSVNATDWGSVTNVDPYVNIFYYNFTVYDADGFGDIKQAKMVLTYQFYDDNTPERHYAANYTESSTVWKILAPYPAEDYYFNTTIASCSRNVIDAYNVTYSFAVKLNKTAQETVNDAATWNFRAWAEDDGGDSGDAIITFDVTPFSQITVTGNQAVTNFRWAGTAQSVQSATFYTKVTVNDGYELNASYNGWFSAAGGATWGDPVLTVKEASQPATTPLPNATAGQNNTWYTSPDIPVYQLNQTHIMYLVFPVGISKGYTYIGVTINIQVKND